jgi:hypothetical protein
MGELHLHIYMYIASLSIESWRSMLAIPEFARFTLTAAGFSFAELCHCRSDETKNETWKLGCWVHRGNDLPARTEIDMMNIYDNDLKDADCITRYWYHRNRKHRGGDKPAFENTHLYEWFQHGQRHRDGDQPAITYMFYKNSTRIREASWWKMGQLHRDEDKPAVMSLHPDGVSGYIDIQYWKYGLLHRDGDEPAVINQHTKKFYKRGKLHRDGNRPAVIMETSVQYWRDGKQYQYKES